MKRFREKLWKVIGKISIVDRFLLFFLFLLFAYMIIHLLYGNFSQETNTIDVLVRTSAAAIFGYFISGNFLKTEPISESSQTGGPVVSVKNEVAPNPSPQSTLKAQIGFQVTSQDSQETMGNVTLSSEEDVNPKGYYGKVQIVVVSIIGILSLAILIFARHYQEITPELTAIISQLRDFTFACIGFLVSCGKDTSQ